MATPRRTSKGVFFVVALLMAILSMMSLSCQAQLSPTFYDKTCPKALDTIKNVINSAITEERKKAANLLRLYFHDCFVHGCDASILLADGGEQTAIPNVNSITSYDVIAKAKAELEKICPETVSCSDIVAVAARDAVVAVGGPSWGVKLGRRDSTNGYPNEAVEVLPAHNDTLAKIISKFEKKGLSTREMVALSGAHTIGQAVCFAFKDRINNSNNSDIDPAYAAPLKRDCPLTGRDFTYFAPMDSVTPTTFDNNYYKNLMRKKALLPSDHALYNAGGQTKSVVEEYARDAAALMKDFAAAIDKVGDMKPLTGSQGQIRRTCGAVNHDNPREQV